MHLKPSKILTLALPMLALGLSGTALKAQFGAPTGAPPTGNPGASVNFGGNGGTDRGPQRRTILGSVQDPNGNHLTGATVFLKNVKKASVVSISADDQGTYRFGSLPLSEDYEVWAVVNGHKSPVKPVSSFLTQKDVTIILKVDKAPIVSR